MILWTKSPDEAVFCRRFNGPEKRILENIFDAAHSPFAEALQMLSFPPCREKLVHWHEDVPYFNTSALVDIVSGGAVAPVREEDGGFSFRVQYKPRLLWTMMKRQFRLTQFAANGAKGADEITLSLALGLALQSYMLQLGGDAKKLAPWLANPGTAPPRYRRVVKQIQAVQVKRTTLSPAWAKLFPPQAHDAPPSGLPDYFWDAPSPHTQALAPAPEQNAWQGLPVCSGQVVGRIVSDLKNIPAEGPLIFVFRQARPETTEVFARAAGLVFGEGGVLSHACTVAREMNIPSVTGIGAGIYDFAKQHEGGWLALDGGAGMVKLVESSKETSTPSV